ncbi:MAG: hypothetical protein A2Z20_11325 [Bdellovibrionales bacterium RBG_16_40_8]|nr:MAG: hypothetical protein A2Z20_11325 [Bdellovibrionales bacterium RBG_16_40_8]
MKTSAIIKLNFLLLGLALTFYAIYSLNTRGINSSISMLLGLNLTGKTITKHFNFNWCNARVAGLIIPEKFKVLQDGQNWIAEGNKSRNVDFIAMEKWLAQSCSSQAERVNTGKADEPLMPALIIKFVDGSIDMIRRNSRGVYVWKGQAFTSSAFDQALAELPQLPEGQRK